MRTLAVLVALALVGCGSADVNALFGEDYFSGAGGRSALATTGGSPTLAAGGSPVAAAGAAPVAPVAPGAAGTSGASGASGGAVGAGGTTAAPDACVPATHDNGVGQTWQDCVPPRTWNQDQALSACEAWCAVNECTCHIGLVCNDFLYRVYAQSTDYFISWEWQGVEIGNVTQTYLRNGRQPTTCTTVNAWN